MFRHTKRLQYDARPAAPDAAYAAKLQELIGGAYGEMTVTMQYLFQGWNCRMPGKYKDMLLDIGTEEIGHVEMLSTMVARLLEGAPAETTAKHCAANPALAAIVGGQNPQHAIVAGGGAALTDSAGEAWSGKYIVASGNLMADFAANAAAEMQGLTQATRLYNMTDDPGVRDMLQFNIARDTMHQNQWLAAMEELKADGIEGIPTPANHPWEERNLEHSYTFWNLSDGEESAQGRWASGPTPDGKGEFVYLADPQALSEEAEPTPPKSDPMLYATAPESDKRPAVDGPGEAPGAESMLGKLRDKLT